MRWVTFANAAGDDRVGIVKGDSVYALDANLHLVELLGDDGQHLRDAADHALQAPREVFPLADAKLRSPISHPPTVRDFYAFEQHVRTARKRRGLEMDPDWYELPVFYFSNPYAVCGPYDDVAIPPGSNELDFELEVAAVVGKAGVNLSPAEAEKHIAGFTIMNDWSARDLQRREMKLSMGPVKGKDSATSLGPIFVSADELQPFRQDKAYDLTMTATVNGKEYSRASLADIYWSFAEMVSYASRGTRVEPGDIVGSGTCGTGCILELSLVHGSDQFPWLKVGDVVELSVDQLGTQRSRIVAGLPLHPLR